MPSPYRTRYATKSNYSNEPYSPFISVKQRRWIKEMYENTLAWLTTSAADNPDFAQEAAAAIVSVQEIIPRILSENWEELRSEDGKDLRCTKQEASTCISALRPVAERIPKGDGDIAPAGIDLRGLHSGKYAVPDGETRLKVQIDVVTTGKWAGWVFVKDAAVYGAGKKYGMQRPGQTYKGEIEDALRAILANPVEAMAEYGRLTEICGLCGLPLENKESVERGIGPVCAKKLGI